MSEEQLKAFLEKVKADTSLQDKLKAAADADAVTAIAKEAGFNVSADDLTKDESELSDEELEGVAGGFFNLLFGPGPKREKSWNCTNVWKMKYGEMGCH